MADDGDVVEDEQVAAEAPPADVAVETEAPEEVQEQPLAPPKYEVRPLLGEKFQAQNVREIILRTLQEQLMGRAYKADMVSRWCRQIANGVRQRVQDLNMKRYKIVVYVQLLEMKGAGAKCAQRCIWDPETDDWADNLYRNDTMFAYVICYGVYMY